MDKAQIEFLLKAGYTLTEIMQMGTPAPADTDPADPAPAPAPAPTPSSDPAPATVDAQLASLKTEIAQLRTALHDKNRQQTVIEPSPKQTTFEEDIEQMIKEVTS